MYETKTFKMLMLFQTSTPKHRKYRLHVFQPDFKALCAGLCAGAEHIDFLHYFYVV
jgi:hypothetical protein